MTGPTVSATTYPASRVEHEGVKSWLERESSAKNLIIEGGTPGVLDAFHGTADGDRFVAPADAQNALALRRTLPWLAPRRWGLATTAGTGDRPGLCTPGHARAFAEVGGVKPVFAQQSIREMGRTHRTPRNVLDDATWGAFQAGWTVGVGADADHLKTPEDVDRCAEAGFVEHVVIVREPRRFGIEFVSFSPRWVGEFKGDLDALRRDVEVHTHLARALGPYKLSLHSGSDKYSTYQPLAEATQGVVHLKTAGTSWVESLRVVARFDPDLFLTILRLSRQSFEANRASYRLSCDLAKVPVSPSPDELDDLITRNDSRQVLHVGFGPALSEYGDQFKQVLSAHDSELEAIIAAHFTRHLAPFAAVAQQ